MTEIVFAIAAKVAEYLVAPIERSLGYLFRHRSHIHHLYEEIEKLRARRDDVQIAVEEAMRRGEAIRPIVQHWLIRVDEMTMQGKELKKDENESRFNCPNLKSRYQLSRRAQKMTYGIVAIQYEGHFFDSVSYPATPQNVLESRASILNKIMDALTDDETKMIGVWGMGGVGKTTLVKQVVEQARQAMLFTTQVYLNVSWTRDSERIQHGIAKIQQQIADTLGLKLMGKDESTRAVQLKQRMNKERILIILDDIWKVVDLEKVGIPSEDGQKEYKIILASRDRRLCKDMCAQKCFLVKHLPPEEAWSLFKKTAGDSVETLELRPTAIEVVEECDGLPVAIVTIAKALKGESVAIWENALDELRRSSPTNIRGMGEKVYSSLKLSYHHLEGDEVKRLFLLCGMLGGMLGYGDISMDDLSNYGMGSDLFEHISSSDKLVKLVKILKDSSLLLDVEDGQSDESSSLFSEYDQNKFVRMHRVVCAVARAIASEDPRWFAVKEALQSGDGQRRRSSENALVSC